MSTAIAGVYVFIAVCLSFFPNVVLKTDVVRTTELDLQMFHD